MVNLKTSEIVRLLRGRKTGTDKWQAKCPVSRNHTHGDRHPSLSIAVGRCPGFTVLQCRAGCDIHEIVSAAGLKLRDLCGEGEITPEIRQRIADEDRLKLLERRNGLAILAQVIEWEHRNYWVAVERNTDVEIHQLRDRIYPTQRIEDDRAAKVQALIAEYGWDELWNCVPDGEGK